MEDNGFVAGDNYQGETMGSRRLGQLDLDTGEVMEGSLVYVAKRAPHPYGVNMMQVNQDFLAQFAARKDVSARTLRVFLLMASKCDFENWLHVPLTDVANELDIEKANVTRAIQQLEELGILLRGPKVGRSNTFRFNPNAGWKGKVHKLRPAMDRQFRSITGGKRDDAPTAAELEAAGQDRLFPA